MPIPIIPPEDIPGKEKRELEKKSMRKLPEGPFLFPKQLIQTTNTDN